MDGVFFGEFDGDLFDEPKASKLEATLRSVKKQQRFENILVKRRAKRSEEHKRRKHKLLTNEPDVAVRRMASLEVSIDFGFCELMSVKENRKLARQIGRVWGLQKRYRGLSTTLISPPLNFVAECRKILTGFDNYSWNVVHDTDVADVLPRSSIIYLSPDAKLEPLMDLREDEVYVIGGLVDESGKGSKTKDKADYCEYNCRRLPIQEFMEKAKKGTHNVMLAVNQVFEILCKYAETRDWRYALAEVVPKRTGYRIINA